jgi:hypothetical protein
MSAPPVGAIAYLFGSYPQSLGDAAGKTYAKGPINSPITILRDDPLVSPALSSLPKCGILWYGENWTSQAGAGID